jgi:hypothetical protein
MKKAHIQIHDTRTLKNGPDQFYVKYVAANGETLAHTEVVESFAAVNKSICAMDRCFSFGHKSTFTEITEYALIVDHTKGQHWAKKYGCKKGKKP